MSTNRGRPLVGMALQSRVVTDGSQKGSGSDRPKKMPGYRVPATNNAGFKKIDKCDIPDVLHLSVAMEKMRMMPWAPVAPIPPARTTSVPVSKVLFLHPYRNNVSETPTSFAHPIGEYF